MGADTISISPARSDRLRLVFDDAEAQLEATVDYDALDQPGKIDWLLFKNYLDFERATLASQRAKAEEIADMLPFAAAIIELEEDRSLLRPQQPQESATIVAAIGEQAADAQAELAARVEAEEPSMKLRISARRAAMAVGELRRALSSWNEYYAEWHPEFGWWLREPFATTDSLLDKYQIFLREEVAHEVETARGGIIESLTMVHG